MFNILTKIYLQDHYENHKVSLSNKLDDAILEGLNPGICNYDGLKLKMKTTHRGTFRHE